MASTLFIIFIVGIVALFMSDRVEHYCNKFTLFVTGAICLSIAVIKALYILQEYLNTGVLHV